MKRDEDYNPHPIPIVSAVRQIRAMDPAIGYYKQWHKSRRMYLSDRLPVRDTILRLLRHIQLMHNRPKPRHTTNSNHRIHKNRNHIRGIVSTRANQLWVSDITYIHPMDGSCHLHHVTEAHSHHILVWSHSSTLEAEHTLQPLRKAITQATADHLQEHIHHSDRGVQNCSDAYTDELKRQGVRISMTEDYKPTDNAIAHRVNGTLKSEYIYRERRFKTIDESSERIASFIRFYNDRRPHASIGMKGPSAAHKEQGMQRRMW